MRCRRPSVRACTHDPPPLLALRCGCSVHEQGFKKYLFQLGYANNKEMHLGNRMRNAPHSKVYDCAMFTMHAAPVLRRSPPPTNCVPLLCYGPQ